MKPRIISGEERESIIQDLAARLAKKEPLFTDHSCGARSGI
jgi:hypothetical protein